MSLQHIESFPADVDEGAPPRPAPPASVAPRRAADRLAKRSAWSLGLLLLCFVGGAPASANEVGMNAHVPTDDALDALADLGVHWVRVDANWFVMEPREGAYDWREMDRVVQGADARGLKVFMTLAYAPQWATEPNGDEIATNDIPRAGTYGRFVEAAVSRYRAMGVTHYGIWNEPNLRQFFEGTVDEYADRIVRPGSDAVRRACEDCFALGPDLAGIGGWQAYLGDVLERVGDRFDILAHHTYRAPQSVGARWICDDFDHAMDIGDDAICFYSPGLRQVLDGAAWQGEVWLTETGHRADPWDDPGAQADQVATVEHVIDRQLATPWWTNTFFYELIDCRPAQPDCPIDGYGFLRRTAPTDDTWRDNFIVKPVFEALQRLIDEEPALGRVAPIEPPPPPMAPRIEAPRRSEGAPDGALDEWDDSGCVVLDDYEVLGAPRAGPADVSARACAAWSEDALWLSVDVEDAVHDNEQPADLIWQGDSVQLAVDVDADAAGAGYDADDLEIGLALAGGETRLFAFHGALGAADGAVRRDGARTRYELKVPLPALAPERVVRASFLVNDADGNGRDGWLEWTPGIGREKDPSAFGEVVLADRQSMPPPPPGPPAEDGGRPPPPLPAPPDVGGGGTGDIDGGAEAETDAGPGGDAATGEPAEDADAAGFGRAPSGDAGTRIDAGSEGDGDGGDDGGCDVTEPSPGGSLLWWLLLAGVGVRRRSRAR